MNVVVRARMDEELKNQATKVLQDIGLMPSDAIRMLFTCIAKDQALPQDLMRPSPRLKQALKEAEQMLKEGLHNPVTVEELFDEAE